MGLENEDPRFSVYGVEYLGGIGAGVEYDENIVHKILKMTKIF